MEKPKIQVTLPDEYTEQLYQQFLQLANRAVEQATQNVHVNNRYLNQEELKKYLGIGQALLDEMVIHGLSYVKLGRQKLFDLEDVYQYLEKNKN